MYTNVLERKTYWSNASTAHVAGRPSIVFIHGAAMDHTVWTLPARFFARRGFNVVAVDLPGHGRSQGPAFDDIGATAQWLEKLLASLESDDHILIGHSMGSLIAWEFAAQFPERCRKLALLGTSMPMQVTDVLMGAAERNESAAFEMANTWSHSTHGKIGFNANPGIWMFAHGQRLMNRSEDDVFHADLTACNNAKLDATKILCECLLILGEADQMTPARAASAVAQQTPNAEVVSLPGCGHSMLAEQPNQVLDALRDFVLDQA